MLDNENATAEAASTPAASGPNAGAPPPVDVAELDSLNTDQRQVSNWQSRYEPKAIHEIRVDAILVSCILFITFAGIVCTWNGVNFRLMSYGCDSCSPIIFSKYAYFFFGGLLGGSLYGIKYLYKVVAHGFWNIDRRLWRIFSPFLAGGLAIAVGALLDSGILGLASKSASSSSYLSIGFLTGYFADSALAKMQDIAKTVFGTTERR